MKKLLSKTSMVLSLSSLMFFQAEVNAQSFTFPASGSKTITTCSGHLYDDGGADGNYSMNSEGMITILPENGKFVKLTLNEFNAYFSELKFYFGENTNAPSMTFEDFLVPSSGPKDVFYGSPVNGAITLTFKTGDYETSGLDFTIECLDAYPAYDFALAQGSGVISDTVPKAVNFGNEASPQNVSETPTGPYTMSYFLSTDKVLDAGDRLLFEDVYTSVTKGSFNYINEGIIQVPEDVPVGKYYFFTVMDYDNVFPEIDEDNNFQLDSVIVREPIAEAEASEFVLSASKNNSKNKISFGFKAEASGDEVRNIPALDWVIKAGVSDDVKDASIVVASGLLNDVDSYMYDPYEASFVPASIGITENGTYHLFLILDPENKLDLHEKEKAMQELTFEIDNSIEEDPAEISLPLSGNDVVNTCRALIFDNGGPEEDYEVNTSGSLTIYPQNQNQTVELTVSMLDLTGFDELRIFDGAAPTDGKLIESLSYDSDISEDNKKKYTASAPGAALTVQLKSTSTFAFMNPGFEALVSCPTVSGNKDALKAKVTIGPNPANTFVQINMVQNSDQFTGSIYSIDGSLVKAFVNSNMVELEGLKAGSYVLNLVFSDGSVQSHKFIKR